MPCDTISTAGVTLGANVDPALLVKALAELELSPQRTATAITFSGGFYDLQTKQATFRTSAMAGQSQTGVDTLAQRIRDNYGKQVIYSQAERYKWKIKELGNNKYQVIKNTY